MGGDPLVVVQAARLIRPTATTAAKPSRRLMECPDPDPVPALFGG
jgi:hypothetical protein